ncbi:hypothetical protein ERJ75_001443200 [Trypanosoma vivax]|nr:hypothetical protein ERJ75_001443200 [Trypanosoma vivax]
MQQDSESDGPIPKQRVVSAMTHRALCPLDSDAGIIKLCPSPSCQADIERSALSSPRVKILMAPKPSFVASDRSHGGSRSDNHLGFQLYSVNTDSTSSGKEASGLCNSFIRTGQGGGEASSTSISFLNHPGLGKDPKAAREALHEAFPESLFYITVDDMAAEAVAQGETAIVSDCGFHRQFTEQMLLDIYELIVSTSNLAEERQRFLMCSSQLEVGEADMKAYTRAATDESMRELSIYDDVWYLPSIDSDNGVLTAVTARPPEFRGGMLWNGEDKFLFDGAAFVEEARVFALRVPRDFNLKSPTTCISPEFSEGTSQVLTENSLQSDKVRVHLLLREFSSVSKLHLGFMVQSFTLITDLPQVNFSKNQLLQPDQIRVAISASSCGAVTRAFSLQLLLPVSMRHASNSVCAESHACPWRENSSDDSQREDRIPGLQSCSMFFASQSGFFSGANTIMSTRSRRGRTTTRQPLGDEIYLRFTNPKLYAWVMQHSPKH